MSSVQATGTKRFRELFGGPLSGPERWLAGTVAGLCVFFTAGALLIHPSVFPDPAYGLLVHKSMEGGAPWNHMLEPRPEDITQDRSYFYATWSPGQYAVPAAFMKLGLSLGNALSLVNILASVLGLLGWFLLFRVLGFERLIALVACAFIAASRTFGFSFLTYVGGDLLAFSAFPYLAIGLFALRGSPLLMLASPMIAVVGFFFKNSMAIHMASWVVAVAAVTWLHPARFSKRTAALFIGTVAALVAAMRFLEWSYVSRGWTAVTYQPVWTSNVAAYVLPWSMPFLAATGLDNALSRLFNHPELPKVDYKSSLLLTLPVVFLSATLVLLELRDRKRREVVLKIVLFVGAVVLVFTYLHTTGSSANLDLSRHYIVPGFTLLPLIVSRLLRVGRPVARQALLLLLFGVPALYGVLSFAANWKRHFDRRTSRSPEVQVTHLTLTPRLVQYLRALDRDLPGGSTLAVMPIPSFAFEFTRTRVLSTSATSDGIPEIRGAARKGRVDNLVVVAEREGQTPEEIAAWLASFESYDPARWDVFEADGFEFYVPLGQPIDRAWLEAEFRKAAEHS